MPFVFIYATAKDKEEARKIAHHLIKKRLIACANIFPSQSIYEWKGVINEDEEYILILKTVKEKSILVKKEIERIHSYQIPCITEILINPNQKYARWLKGQCR